MANFSVLLYNPYMKKTENIHKYIWIEFLIWFLILSFVIVGVRIHRYHKEKELVTYQLFMSDVDGIIVGSPVKFMGVQVGFVDKIKIVSNEVYLKIVITDKNVTLPKGSIVTVEFNGMGGSKSLEIYPPTEESLASKKLLVVQGPKRLHDSLGLLNAMFEKIDSISMKLSFFAKETGLDDINGRIKLDAIQGNINLFDRLMKEVKNEKRKGD